MNFSDLFTVFRATSGFGICYVKRPDGSYEVAETDTPRFQDGGLLIERNTVNQLAYNRNLDNSVWSAGGAATVSQGTGIDGGPYDILVDDSSAVNTGRVQQDRVGFFPIPGSDQVYAGSVFVGKTSSAPTHYPAVQISALNGVGTDRATYIVNTFTGALIVADADTGGHSAEVEDAGNFWRVKIKFLRTAANNSPDLQFRLYPAYNSDGSSASTPSATGSTLFDMSQFELNEYVSSPMENQANFESRTDEQVTDLTTTWKNINEGTLFLDVEIPEDYVFSTNRSLVSLVNGSSVNRYHTIYSGLIYRSVDNVNGINIGATSNTPGRYRLAFTYGPNGRKYVIRREGGDKNYYSSAVPVTPDFDQLKLGAGPHVSGTIGDQAPRTVYSVKYWPREMSEEEIRALVP